MTSRAAKMLGLLSILLACRFVAFQDRANKDIIPAPRERQLVSQANTAGVGILAAQRNPGSVMVYLNRTVTDESKQPVYDGSRLKVDYVKVDGEWLINYITPI